MRLKVSAEQLELCSGAQVTGNLLIFMHCLRSTRHAGSPRAKVRQGPPRPAKAALTQQGSMEDAVGTEGGGGENEGVIS